MKPAPFAYCAPRTVAEAVAELAERGEDAKVLAGGQSLVPMMAFRLARPAHLVDLGGIDDLRGVRHDDGEVVIGALSTHAALEHDPTVHAAVPLLGLACPLIGHAAIRNRGTIGGSLAHADPAAELPAVALALDATVTAVSPTGTRTVPAAELFDGLWTTTLAADEIITDVRLPRWTGGAGFAAEEFARRHGDYALAGAMVGLELDDGAIARCAIALFGVAPAPVRAAAAERAATGERAGALSGAALTELAELAVEGLDPADDVHASGAHRRALAAVMVERAVDRALARARHAGELARA